MKIIFKSKYYANNNHLFRHVYENKSIEGLNLIGICGFTDYSLIDGGYTVCMNDICYIYSEKNHYGITHIFGRCKECYAYTTSSFYKYNNPSIIESNDVMKYIENMEFI